MGEVGLDRPALAERRRALGRHHLEPREIQRRHVALAQRSLQTVILGPGAGGQDRRQHQRAGDLAVDEAKAAGVATPVAARRATAGVMARSRHGTAEYYSLSLLPSGAEPWTALAAGA